MNERKGGLRVKKNILMLSIVAFFMLSACNDKQSVTDIEKVDDKNTVEAVDEEVEAMDLLTEWNRIVEENVELRDIVPFLRETLPEATEEEADQIVAEFERMQFDYLPHLEEKFFEDNIQEKLHEHFEGNEVEDEKVVTLLEEADESGYKVEMAEGTYFPIINYGAYRDFLPYVSNEFGDYIEIMARESDELSAKDAAIVVTWNELVERAANQEAFLREYPQSEKKEHVKALYDKYVKMILFGLDNTPLFQYEDDRIDEEALKQYKEVLTVLDTSETKTMLQQFIELVEKSGGLLTDEIEQFRAEMVNE